jgi:transcriptional regulator with XRE-family HTH domain
MSLRGFANLSGLSVAYVYALENDKGHSPTIETLKKIAHVMHMSLQELMFAAGYFNE